LEEQRNPAQDGERAAARGKILGDVGDFQAHWAVLSRRLSHSESDHKLSISPCKYWVTRCRP
jgi:hypothetical protein